MADPTMFFGSSGSKWADQQGMLQTILHPPTTASGISPVNPPASNSSMLLDPSKYAGSDHEASLLAADLYRSQWNNYMQTFAPIEDQLNQSVLNGTNMTDALAKVAPAVKQQTDLAQQDATQRMARYGLKPTAEMKAAQDAQFQRASMATEASLRNQVRQSVRDSDLALMAGASQGQGTGGM